MTPDAPPPRRPPRRSRSSRRRAGDPARDAHASGRSARRGAAGRRRLLPADELPVIDPFPPAALEPTIVDEPVFVPEPMPAQAPAVEPSVLDPFGQARSVFRVVVRLQDGDGVEVGEFRDFGTAMEGAQEVIEQFANANGSWPFYAGRFIRPDLIVSVDVVDGNRPNAPEPDLSWRTAVPTAHGRAARPEGGVASDALANLRSKNPSISRTRANARLLYCVEQALDGGYPHDTQAHRSRRSSPPSASPWRASRARTGSTSSAGRRTRTSSPAPTTATSSSARR